MKDYTNEIRRILNKHALPSTLRHLGRGKVEITDGFIKDTDGKFQEIAKEIESFYRKNTNKDTIFKEELEKRLPSDEEVKDNAEKEIMSLEFWSLEEWNAFITGSEWLIQYLKK